MASNKFATMLQRNTNRITMILVYALLEWFLITLLLLNSLFSYFITKFVEYFGLKPPCLWCSRIDHILNPTANTSDPYRNHLCEAHSAEISQLGYCKIHRRLAEYETMCIDCFSSWPNLNNEQVGVTRSIGYISWVSNDAIENGGMALRCSCCDASLSRDLYPPCLLVKTSWGASMKYSQKGGSVLETIEEMNKREPLVSHDEGRIETKKDDSSVIPRCLQDYSPLEIINHERNSGLEIERTVPLELIDLSTIANRGRLDSNAGGLKRVDHANPVDDNQVETNLESSEERMGNMEKLQVIDIEEMVQDMVEEACKQVVSSKQARALPITSHNIYTGLQMTESADELSVDQTRAVQVNKLSDRESNQSQAHQEPFPTLARQTVICSSPDELGARLEEIIVVEPTTSADKKEGGKSHLSDPYDDKLPETPNSVDSIHNLHKKLLIVGKRETGAEESMDGSVVSETEGSDPFLAIEKLKAALNAERKALSSVYAELEEERSASAIAANQTMAMINRLQEEKAAVQMEALQYQRMMEEQSEYDQEALQLLNELMIKREKEKQELEKELQVYRHKVLDYESKEKTRSSSSATRSNGEDINEISFDFNTDRGSHGMEITNNNAASNGVDQVTNLQEIALDCVKHISALDDSMAEFEEERLSILDQLKALEEKLLNLNDNEDFTIEDEKSTECSSSKYCVKGLDESHELNTPEGEGGSSSLPNQKSYPERKTMGSMVKNLLPLLDTADDDDDINGGFSFEDISASGRENSPASNSELESKKIAIEEEVDHVYERLQALEADREFLKHCMSSIQKGDRGMDLLQEILQHLRDLRAAELRTRNLNVDLLQQFEVGKER